MKDIKVIPPQSGTSFILKKDEVLKVICPDGEQVADLVAYNASDYKEYLHNGKTFDYEESLLLSKGNVLYSNESNPMLEIIEDTCGRHDFLLAPCCPTTFKHFYNISEKHPSCRHNLYNSLKNYGIEMSQIPTAFNIFMYVRLAEDGKIQVLPPLVKKGGYVAFKANMDLLIGLTSCSAGASNNYSYKAIHYEIKKTF